MYYKSNVLRRSNLKKRVVTVRVIRFLFAKIDTQRVKEKNQTYNQLTGLVCKNYEYNIKTN